MKKFIKNNKEFICENCGLLVAPHPSSSRDHCTFCLFGMHVDINPGDRMNDCKGVLEPIGIRSLNGKTQIVYKCQKCSEKVFNIAAIDDSRDELNKLYTKVWM